MVEWQDLVVVLRFLWVLNCRLSREELDPHLVIMYLKGCRWGCMLLKVRAVPVSRLRGHVIIAILFEPLPRMQLKNSSHVVDRQDDELMVAVPGR